MSPILRLQTSLLVAVALGHFAGRWVHASGMGSLVALFLCAIACPAALCLLSRSWRVPLGLLVNSVLVASILWESHRAYRDVGGLYYWWRDLPEILALGAVVVALSLVVTVPLSKRARAASFSR